MPLLAFVQSYSWSSWVHSENMPRMAPMAVAFDLDLWRFNITWWCFIPAIAIKPWWFISPRTKGGEPNEEGLTKSLSSMQHFGAYWGQAMMAVLSASNPSASMKKKLINTTSICSTKISQCFWPFMNKKWTFGYLWCLIFSGIDIPLPGSWATIYAWLITNGYKAKNVAKLIGDCYWWVIGVNLGVIGELVSYCSSWKEMVIRYWCY